MQLSEIDSMLFPGRCRKVGESFERDRVSVRSYRMKYGLLKSGVTEFSFIHKDHQTLSVAK